MPTSLQTTTVIGSYILAAMTIAAIVVLAINGNISGETAIAGVLAASGIGGGVAGTTAAKAYTNTPYRPTVMPRTDDA